MNDGIDLTVGTAIVFGVALTFGFCGFKILIDESDPGGGIAYLGLSALIVCAWVVYVASWVDRWKKSYAAKKAKQEAEKRVRQAEAERQEAAERAEESTQQELNKFEKMVKQWLEGDLFLDSNIWMGGIDNNRYDTFFEQLERWTSKSKPIQLPGVQFDEICNIKTKNKSKSNSTSSARMAIGRIEIFQKEEKVIISQVTINSQFSAYADPELIKIVLSKASAGRFCTFISNDKELRIRLRQKLTNAKLSNCTIIDINEIFDEFQAVFWVL